MQRRLDMENDSNLTSFRILLGTMSSGKLCEIIVSNRYLGIMKEEAIICMKELSRRRGSLEEEFLYEEHIKHLMADLPPINIDIKSIFGKFKFQ